MEAAEIQAVQAAPAAEAAKVAGLEALGAFDDASSETEQGEAATTVVAASQAEVVDPLDESLFGDDSLSTPEGVKAARDRILAERKKANELRRKAQNAHAAAEAREAKFKRTKEQTLAERKAMQGQLGMLNSDIAAIRSGDPEAFLKAVGRLSGSADPSKFWREAAIKLVSGGSPEELEGRADPELKREIDEIKATLQQQSAAAQEQIARQQQREIARLRAEQVDFARASTEHRHVATLAKSNPAGIDEALMTIKSDEYERTGRPIDTAAACTLLETELQAQYELFQRANGPVVGDSNGERGTADSVSDRGRETTAAAKPGTPQSQAQAHRHATIPASLSAEPSASKRPTTKEEERQVKIAALSSIGFWND